MAGKKYKHINLPAPENMKYIGTGGGKPRIKSLDPKSHSAFLFHRFENAWNNAMISPSAAVVEDRTGLYLEFKSFPDFDLLTKSLESYSSDKARLCNVREEKDSNDIITTYATVYIKKEYRSEFLRKIQQYAEALTKNGKPKNAPLMNSIADIQTALFVKSFWTDDTALIPNETSEWCEVWLRVSSGEEEKVLNRFISVAEGNGISFKDDKLIFPERMVKLVYASKEQLEFLTLNLDDIAEYRRAKEPASFWYDMPPREQAGRINNFIERLEITSTPNTAICVLDTGVNNGHPMLSPLLKSEDCHSVEPSWGTHDHDKHGTLTAGICAYGNIQYHLSGTHKIRVEHILESSKILPPPPEENPHESWGRKTMDGISLPEIESPDRKRIFCMPVTANDFRDKGRPSSWSGAIDSVTFSPDLPDKKRLLIISAGNIDFKDPDISLYPEKQLNSPVQDPAQAWNALTVGAFTRLTDIHDSTYNGYSPLANFNELSPFSTTSKEWDPQWPIKPEIVMEGGNIAIDSQGKKEDPDDLKYLSTFYNPQKNYFWPFNGTSLSTALASEFAAKIQTRYPDYWPETIRGLMVHSAEWPEQMKRQVACDETKTELKKVLRSFGYGVPNIDNALYTAANSLTLVAQSEIQPFEKETGASVLKDMHLYELPWPKEVLTNLPFGTHVEMRVTLSYFIEPGPGEIGWKDKYRYPSHMFRFAVIPPRVDKEIFVKRINKAMLGDKEKRPDCPSSAKYWLIGEDARDKGSIISDIWNGTAQDLADVNYIAVYPGGGWWKERTNQKKYNNRTRYSLIVSIRTPDESIDIYTPVAVQLSIPITT